LIFLVEAAELIGLSKTTAYGHWAFAKAWLRREMGNDQLPIAPGA
jgi:hypothetical protein